MHPSLSGPEEVLIKVGNRLVTTEVVILMRHSQPGAENGGGSYVWSIFGKLPKFFNFNFNSAFAECNLNPDAKSKHLLSAYASPSTSLCLFTSQ